MLKDFGSDLKALRESKNITIAEISAQTRINPKFITSMEAGVFDFQPETYVRSFLREYAKCIDEDEERILNDYIKAKTGFYSKKKVSKDQVSPTIKPVEPSEKSTTSHDQIIREEKIQYSIKKSVDAKPNLPRPVHYIEGNSDRELNNNVWTKRIVLIFVIIVGLVGLFYLYRSLNNSGRRTSEVKPKSFSEISEDYENKIKGKTEDIDQTKKDSVANVINDSLMLTIKTSKEVRIKVYVDEKKIVEEVIQPKDSLKIFAKQQFRFSASANSSVDLLLNGKLLKKPSYLSGNSIKNLVINKEGIVSQ